MSSERSRSNRQPDPGDKPGAGDPAAAGAALAQAAQAWTALVDDWWRQQSAALPPELKRAMSATLDQFKALVDMAFAQTAGAGTKASAAASPAGETRQQASSAAGELGLWQPVIDACRACQAGLVGNAGEGALPRSAAAGDYQRAASAYLNEFVQINGEVARRVQKKLAAGPPIDFRQLHALVVEEAENAYLDRVSTDDFAAFQAAFINAMFRLRREMAGAGGPGQA